MRPHSHVHPSRLHQVPSAPPPPSLPVPTYATYAPLYTNGKLDVFNQPGLLDRLFDTLEKECKGSSQKEQALYFLKTTFPNKPVQLFHMAAELLGDGLTQLQMQMQAPLPPPFIPPPFIVSVSLPLRKKHMVTFRTRHRCLACGFSFLTEDTYKRHLDTHFQLNKLKKTFSDNQKRFMPPYASFWNPFVSTSPYVKSGQVEISTSSKPEHKEKTTRSNLKDIKSSLTCDCTDTPCLLCKETIHTRFDHDEQGWVLANALGFEKCEFTNKKICVFCEQALDMFTTAVKADYTDTTATMCACKAMCWDCADASLAAYSNKSPALLYALAKCECE